ncbi:S-layer family protein [Oscillatoriales cyanobacterium LEGE 11467]|uniref:S-layer family protein n=1 Tax=Zarconia navalis LEGE 11467 TaxID=1828826 RepID=A0A928VVF9_9CYAN|nr:S-layer family protein [Zarconia navalis]MBE9039452.1 S-layer family protein [Zarconia navalis LEGE 11467]
MSLKVTCPLSIASLLASIAFCPQHTVAQIVPDSSLPTNSIVTVEDAIQQITGGTQAGGNLFHSFGAFNVRTGETAFFDNALTVENIITRVTGGQISQIDGLIRANGAADLFLINPSGILFGANASLDIGGSFVGSTADGIQFDDNSIFSATNPDASPLLTVSVPIGLQFNSSPLPTSTGANPGEIRVEGLGHEIRQPQLSPHIRGPISGLQVPTGNTLALVGRNITLDGGMLTAQSGRIELGSVVQGEVSLATTEVGWTFGYNNISNFRDITLLSKSAVDASGDPSGSIHLQASNLELRDASIVLLQNQGDLPGGDITVNLSDSLMAIGLAPERPLPSSLINETVGSGDGGNLEISTQRLIFLDAGQMGTRTFAPGKSGDVIVNVSNSVLLAGFSLDLNGEPFISNILTLSNRNSGKLGDIRVSTRQLTIRDGGLVTSFSFGTGDGGNVEVNATESIELFGFNPNFSGSSLSTTSLNAGNAGDVLVNTTRLTLRDGGRVDASSIATGNAGNVTVNTSEFVEVRGTVPNPQLITPSLIGSAANIPDPALQEFLGLPPIPSGSPGNVTINTLELRVNDGALVTVQNDGTGNAGKLSIRAGSIFLDDGGITATTASGEGGNLSVQVRNSLQLRNGSQINSEAGGTGNGGNITLDTDTLALLEASRINANAFEGTGGNIAINTQGIFVSPDSAITASSQLGVDGIVQITNPDVDAAAGLVELSSEVKDRRDRVVSGCAIASGNSFTITGRGGLPENPLSLIRGGRTWDDLRTLTGDEVSLDRALSISQTPLSPPQKLLEATGWVVRNDGTVELVADRAGVPRSWSQRPQC